MCYTGSGQMGLITALSAPLRMNYPPFMTVLSQSYRSGSAAR